MLCNSKTAHFKTIVLMWLLISMKKAFQRCITWLHLEEFKKFLTSGQTKNPLFLKLQILEARPTYGSFHPSFFVSLYTYLEGPKRISSSQANFYGICQGLDYYGHIHSDNRKSEPRSILILFNSVLIKLFIHINCESYQIDTLFHLSLI